MDWANQIALTNNLNQKCSAGYFMTLNFVYNKQEEMLYECRILPDRQGYRQSSGFDNLDMSRKYQLLVSLESIPIVVATTKHKI